MWGSVTNGVGMLGHMPGRIGPQGLSGQGRPSTGRANGSATGFNARDAHDKGPEETKPPWTTLGEQDATEERVGMTWDKQRNAVVLGPPGEPIAAVKWSSGTAAMAADPARRGARSGVASSLCATLTFLRDDTIDAPQYMPRDAKSSVPRAESRSVLKSKVCLKGPA